MRHVIESCDASGCGKTREFVLRGTNSPPQDGWFHMHIAPQDDDRSHVVKSACSSECAAKIVATVLAVYPANDLSIDFCPGHSDGQRGH